MERVHARYSASADRQAVERTMDPRSRVVIVGAGVIGLSTGVHLLERFGRQLEVTIVAEKFSPDTTGDKAGTIMLPLDWNEEDGVAVAQTKEQVKIQQWAQDTFIRFHSIYCSEANADVKLVLRPGYIFMYSSPTEPSWKDLVFGFRHVDVKSGEARAVNAPSDCTDIWAFLTYVLDSSNYLQWLMSLFHHYGGLVEKRKISSLDELDSYDIVINCTGLGSRELLGDSTLQPARGQLILVEAPWVNHFTLNIRDDSEGVIYFLPRASNIVLGGSMEKGNWSEVIDSATENRILKGCKQLMPSLSKAKMVNRWAGLRPLRDSVCLESGVNKRGNTVIHCYGHGGQGIVLSWGCAIDIGNVVNRTLKPSPKL